MAITYRGAGTVAENNAAATTLAVPYPPGISAGDVLVLVVTLGSATVATLPSGWLAGGVSSSSGGNLPSERIMLKVATGTEAGSLNVTTPSATGRGIMLRFSGVDTTTPLDNPGSVTASATATNSHVLPSITTTVPGCALVAVGCANAPGGTWTPPSSQGGGWTEVAETSGAVPSTAVDYLIWSGSGATGTVTMTRSSNVRGCAGMLALRPASTPVQSETGGAAAPVLLTAAGGGTALEESDGGTTSDVPVAAAGGGTAMEAATSGGGSTLTVAVAGDGTAAETTAGGQPSTSTIVATGGGTALEHTVGGQTSVVGVTATGGGDQVEDSDDHAGGTATAVTVHATGGGTATEQAGGGGTAAIAVTAAGSGTARESVVGGHGALVLVTASGGGLDPILRRRLTARRLPERHATARLPELHTAARLPAPHIARRLS